MDSVTWCRFVRPGCGAASSPFSSSALASRITLYTSAETAAERISPTVGLIEAVDPHTCLLHTGANSLDKIAVYVASFRLSLPDPEPSDLIAHIRALAARLADAVR